MAVLSRRLRRIGDAVPVASYRGQINNTSNLTEYTFSSVDIGSAAFGRLVVVGVFGQASVNVLSSATIAGVTAALDRQNMYCTIISAVVDSGNTGDIVLTFLGGQLRCAIGVWALYNLTSPTPIDVDGQAAGNTNTSRSVTLDMTADSIAIAIGMQIGTTDITVTNAAERFDNIIEGAVRNAGGDYQASGVESRSITMDAVTALVGAAYR